MPGSAVARGYVMSEADSSLVSLIRAPNDVAKCGQNGVSSNVASTSLLCTEYYTRRYSSHFFFSFLPVSFPSALNMKTRPILRGTGHSRRERESMEQVSRADNSSHDLVNLLCKPDLHDDLARILGKDRLFPASLVS